MQFKEWFNSSNVLKAEYENNNLTITFKNTSKYLYKNVPENIWTEIENTESIGKYVSSNIVKKYEFECLFKPVKEIKNETTEI